MDVIFMAIANSEQDPLPTLSREDDVVYGMLSERVRLGHFVVHRDSHTTTEKIIDQLMLFRDQIVIFHFSGHAGRDLLEMEDQSANALGIASFLEQCPKLKLVVLNGCSTAGQVKRLMELDTHPVVIATRAVVGDATATEFAIRYYQSLAQDYCSLEESFDVAVSAAQVISKNDLSPAKGLERRSEDEAKPVWGIYCKSEMNLDWRLPDFSMKNFTTEYQPNNHLINELLQGFAENDEDSKAIIDDINSGIQRGMLDKREAVLKCLPHPISEQLRKLIVKEQASSGHVFYDRLGHDRLRQIAVTYNTVIELLAAVPCLITMRIFIFFIRRNLPPIPGSGRSSHIPCR